MTIYRSLHQTNKIKAMTCKTMLRLGMNVDGLVAQGGFTTADEMCVNYIHYFPKVDLEVCKSSVTTESLFKFFRLLNEYVITATRGSFINH